MKLWLLRPIKDWERLYDVMNGFVVRASTEEAARKFAQDAAGDEAGSYFRGPRKPVWTDPIICNCIELLPEGEEGIVISDFAAG